MGGKLAMVGAGLVLIGLGAALIYFGYQEQESLRGRLTELVSGSPEDRTVLKFVGGAVCAALGLGLLGLGVKKRER